MKIENRNIGEGHSPFIIAEMSGNHNQSLERALKLVEVAANSGAHALKLQTYTPDTMTIDYDEDEFFINDHNSLWEGNSLYDLYTKAYTPWEWHSEIFAYARKLELIPFSSPFDETAVDFLEDLNVSCYKVSSFENTDIPLIRKIASTGKPMIISTGMASIAELAETVEVARESGCSDIVLLKCTSTYPATPESSNLLTIPYLKKIFSCEVGLSDHTMGIGVAIASVALGATVIEKHFTLSRDDGGVDSVFSMEPSELKGLVVESERAWSSLGEFYIGPTEAEKASTKYRRSLYIVKDLRPGDVLTKENVRVIRPGLGLPPKYLECVIGKTVAKTIPKGTPLGWDIF